MYVDVVATTAAERTAMGVPACLPGGGVWAGWFAGCCLLTVLLPLAVLLCFGLDGGVQGMWWGLDCGQLARLLLMLQRRSKLDLVAASELAQRRARARM